MKIDMKLIFTRRGVPEIVIHYRKPKALKRLKILMILVLHTTSLQCRNSSVELLMEQKLQVVPVAPKTLQPSLDDWKVVSDNKERTKANQKVDSHRRQRAKLLPESRNRINEEELKIYIGLLDLMSQEVVSIVEIQN